MDEKRKSIIFWSYGSICEPYLEKELIKIADIHKVVTQSQNMERQPHCAIDELRKDIRKYNPEFVFSINFFCDVSRVCKEMNVKYIGYTVDVPVNTLFNEELSNDCNNIFMFDKMQYKKFVHRNPEGIYYLPLGADVYTMKKIIDSASQAVKNRYKCDVSFVGSLYSEKDNLTKFSPYISEENRGYIDGIMAVQKNLVGGNILSECLTDSLVEELETLCPELQTDDETKRYTISHYLLGMHLAAIERKEILEYIAEDFDVNLYTQSNVSKMKNILFRGSADSYTEMPIIFSQSKINLNITYRAIETGIPQRVWDICGCGGFLITNFQEELSDYFNIGNDIECYYSKEDLLEKIQFYLEHEETRKRMAYGAYEKVRKYHTYGNRLHKILGIIEGKV